MKISDYIFENKKVYLPLVAQEFNVSLDEVVEVVVRDWKNYENPHMVDNMLIINHEHSRWYYEVCDTRYKRGEYVNMDEIQHYWLKNQKPDQHISMFAHDDAWVKNFDRNGTVSCENTYLHIPWLWIEIDRKDYKKRTLFAKAVHDAFAVKFTLEDMLPESPHPYAWVFSSGNASAHLLINMSIFGNPIISQYNRDTIRRLAHKIAGNVRFGIGNPDVYQYDNDDIKEHFHKCYPDVPIVERYVAKSLTGYMGSERIKLIHELNELVEDSFLWDSQSYSEAQQATENIDPNLYNVNSLIRQPFSEHEKGKHIKGLMSGPGQFVKQKKKLDFYQHPPYLLSWWYDCYKQQPKKIRNKKIAETNYYIEKYKSWYPEIEGYEPNATGYVGPFCSVLYDDDNPDVWIDVNNGYHQDFGSREYSITFDEFIMQMRRNG